ncbi:hypothetical protein K3248_08095 [Candidatus Bartonella raoultii]|uniref:Uncharacterized protein n=1 Tax=Bartonella raoultii TaxID=1457020 RepID=A0ABS7I6K8_9HYPH|nr:hypothetical protein [Bartonella raoultii]MBX4336543.1 hypothetical protein [Bartonella raoultii]
MFVYHGHLSGAVEKITGLNVILDWSESMQEMRFRTDIRWRGEFTKFSGSMVNGIESLIRTSDWHLPFQGDIVSAFTWG